jgi:hypothetical protein
VIDVLLMFFVIPLPRNVNAKRIILLNLVTIARLCNFTFMTAQDAAGMCIKVDIYCNCEILLRLIDNASLKLSEA